MSVIGEAIIEVKPDSKGFGPDVEKSVLGSAKGLAAKVAGVMAGAFVIQQGTQFFKGALEEAEDARKVAALTEAVVKSTGQAANVSSDQLGELAGKLSSISGVDDEVIQSAGNVLLTFTKVKNEVGSGNDVFNQAQEAALNMSAALGTDLQGATLQVGKALNDPIKGLTALSRAGVSFTAEQKEQVKAMVAAGDTLGAQKLILGELSTQFGGAAEAAASPLDRLNVAWGNLKETFGTAILPALGPLVDTISNVVTELQPVFEKLGTVVGDALSTLAPIIVEVIGPIATTLADTFGNVVQALGPPLAAVAGAFSETFSTLGPVIAQVAGTLAESFGQVLVSLTPIIGMIGNLLETLAPVIGEIVADLASVFAETVGPLLETLGPIVTQLLGTLSAAIQPVLAAIGSAVEQLGPVLGQVATTLGEAFGTIVQALAPVLPVIGEIVATLVSQLAPVFGTIIQAVAPLLPLFAQLIAQLVTSLAPILPVLGNALSSVAQLLAGALGQAIQTVVPLVTQLVQTIAPIATQVLGALAPVASALSGAFSQALSALLPVLGSLLTSLAPVITTLVEGLAPVLPTLAQLLGQVAQSLAGALGQALTTLAPVLADLAVTVGQVLGTALQALIPVVIQLVEALAPIIAQLVDSLAPILPVIAEAFGALIEALAPIVTTLVEALGPILGTVGDLVVTLVEALAPLIDAVLPILQTLLEAIGPLLEALSPILTFLAEIFAGSLKVAIEVVSAVLGTVIDALKAVIDFVVGIFSANWSQTWETMKTGFETIWNAIVGVVTGAWDFITGLFDSAIGTVKGLWDGFWNGLTGVAEAVWNGITSKVSAAWDVLVGAFNAVKDTVTGIWDTLWGGVKSTVEGVVDTIGGLWTTISDGFKAVVNGIIGAWNAIDFGLGPWKIPDWIPVVGGKTFGIEDIFPDIPLLARGDVVTRPTLGIFGEAGPEVILPLSNRKRLIELLLQALTTGGGIPQFAAGAIIGANMPSSAPTAPADFVALLRALLAAANLSLDAVPLTTAGLAPGNVAVYDQLLAAARAIGASVTVFADGVARVDLAGVVGEAAARGIGLAGTSFSGFTIDVVPSGSTAPVMARDAATASSVLSAAALANPFDRDPLAFEWMRNRDGFQALLAARPSLAQEAEAYASLARAMNLDTGLEYQGGVWVDRATGRVVGFSNFEDQEPQSDPIAALGGITDAMIEAGVRKVGDVVPRALVEQWNLQSLGLSRKPTPGDIALTDFGWSMPTAGAQRFMLAAMERAGWLVDVAGDALSGAALTPSGSFVKIAGWNTQGNADTDPTEAVTKQTNELRRSWAALGLAGVDAATITTDRLTELTALLPKLFRIAVTVAGYLPAGWSLNRMGEVDGAGLLRRLGVPQLASGGIISPRSGGTLVNVAEAGRPEAVIPLPPGFVDQLTAPTSTRDGRRVFEFGEGAVQITGVRDADRLPSALIDELDHAVWQAGG